MILVFTRVSDLGADLVIRHLAQWGVDYRRINTEALGTRGLHVAFMNGCFVLVEDGSQIQAGSVQSVWMRRFSHPTVLDDVDVRYRGFVRRELSTALDGFIDAVEGIQVNPLVVDQTAGNRLLQATRAARAGFLVPDTLVTQERDRAAAFLTKHPSAVTKAISFGLLTEDWSEHAYTTQVDATFDTSGLAACPALFQAFVPKRHEWRVTTVGNAVFAARTRANAQVDKIDWRRSADAADIFEPATLPPDTQCMLLSLCASCGLVFGTHDLIETPSGDFYFLETNPAGQWGWLELRLGLPIGRSLAAVLASETSK